MNMPGFIGLFTFGLSIVAMAQPLLTNEEPKEAHGRMRWVEVVVPGSGGEKLEIRFTARAEGEHTIERDARIQIRSLRGPVNSVNLQFFDGNHRQIDEENLPIFSEAAREYARVLVVPKGAKSLQIFLEPAPGETLWVEKLSLSQELEGVEAASINPHPVFSYGGLNPYGFHSGFGGGFFERPDGITVWNTGFTGTSPGFPVEGGENYEWFCRGVGYSGKKSKLFLLFFKRGKTKPFHQMSTPFSAEGKTLEVKFPDEADRASLLGYDVIIEEWKIIKATTKTFN